MQDPHSPKPDAADGGPRRVDGDAAGDREPGALRDAVVGVLKTVYDPEIPVDIYELGLVYGVEVDDSGKVDIKMTLTSPACPVAESLPGEVEAKARSVDGVRDVKVELVWDPPWDKEMMSEAAQLKLGFM